MVVVEKDCKFICRFLFHYQNIICKQVIAQCTNNSEIVETLYDAMLHYLKYENNEHLTHSCKQIAMLKISSHCEITDSLDFIDHMRKVIIDFTTSEALGSEEALLAMKQINDFYFLVSKRLHEQFTRLKDDEIQKQNQFINDMHHDRLTILGKLSTSFAHEFRNPLTSIKGFVHLLQRDYGERSDARHYFTIINDEIETLEDHLTQFLLLSKEENHEDYHKSVFSLKDLILEITEFLSPAFLEKNIRVILNVNEEFSVLAVRQQIKQVLLHIFNNATDALLHRQKHRIIVVHAIEEDGKVQIAVQNNGPMIPAHLVESIFEPFISTKELATGLGLAVSKQIIEKHGGMLSCASEQDTTTFLLKLKLFV